jgi:hypothetical protein
VHFADMDALSPAKLAKTTRLPKSISHSPGSIKRLPSSARIFSLVYAHICQPAATV